MGSSTLYPALDSILQCYEEKGRGMQRGKNWVVWQLREGREWVSFPLCSLDAGRSLRVSLGRIKGGAQKQVCGRVDCCCSEGAHRHALLTIQLAAAAAAAAG